MTTPLIILCGQMGSGKDTVASILREHGAVSLALADPIKRFVRKVLGFSESHLWGESAERERLVPFYLNQSRASVLDHVDAWFEEIDAPNADRGSNGVRYGVYWTWLESLQAFAAGHEGRINARIALQLLGTEWGRTSVGDYLWIDHGIRTARAILRGRGYDREIGLSPGSGAGYPSWVVISDGRFPNEILAVKERGGLAVLIEQVWAEGPIRTHESETSLSKIPRAWWDAVISNDRRAGIASLRESLAAAIRLGGSTGPLPVSMPTPGRGADR